MKDDAISRQAVVDLVEEVENKRLKGEIDLTYAPMINGINALPPTQPEWISCSKKLPELNRSVLVQLSNDFIDRIQIMTFNISKCEGDFFYFWRTQEMGIDFDMDDVVAWMPLPKKWEGEKS